MFVWPLLGVAALFYLPFWRDSALPTGVWFGSERGRKLAIWSAVIGAVATLLIILGDNLILSSTDVAGNTLMTRGLLPTLILLALLVVLYRYLVKKLSHTRAEAVLAGLVLLSTALTICTIVGVWFRGAEMHLVWPWMQ